MYEVPVNHTTEVEIQGLLSAVAEYKKLQADAAAFGLPPGTLLGLLKTVIELIKLFKSM